MNKKGYSNIVILYLFTILSSLCLLILNINIYKAKTIYNLKIANEFLNQELLIISYIKCQLLNNELVSENITLNGINFTINADVNLIEVKINGDKQEIIKIYTNGNRITNYKTSIIEEFGI